MSFRKKIFFAVLMGTLIALAIPLLYARLTVQDFLLEETKAEALREARLISHLMNALPSIQDRQKYLNELATSQTQLTIFSKDGKRIMESTLTQQHANAESEPLHPEVHTALSLGQGFDIRYSNTEHTIILYSALPLADGNILRIGRPFSGFQPQIEELGKTFILILLASSILSLLISYALSGLLKRDLAQMMRVIEAISLGHYYRRLRFYPGEEFAPLAEAVNRMAINISEHISTMTDQKEQLQSILDTMNEGVLVFDHQGDIRSCNKALRNMFPNTDKALGKQVVEVIPTPALQQAVEDILQIPADAENTANVITTIKENPLHLELAPGRFFAIHLTRAGSTDINLGAVAVFHDISPIMRLERVRRDFVANVSHELRTPLTAIQGYAETLADLEDMPEDCRRFAEIIRKNGAYLAKMVEELLALARLENADTPIQVSSIKAIEGVQAAIGLCRQQFEMRNMHIQVDIDENILIMADLQHITQIFRNLLENAARYASQSSTVYIKAQKDNTMHAMTRFAVCDNGPGIPQADKDRIFERFYRVEKHRSHASTGLGLAICKHTVEGLGGQIWVESPTKDHSTGFYFTIPTAFGESSDRTT